MKILIIDIETTTFLNDGGKIIELGATSLDTETGETNIELDAVVNPGLSPEEIQNAWGVRQGYIKPDEIIQARHLKDYLPVLQDLINHFSDGATAYNNEFDFTFLESVGISFPVKLACPMKICTKICKIPHSNGRGYKWPKVEEAFKFFFPESDYKELHRGADDSKHEAMIVYELIKLGLFPLKNVVEVPPVKSITELRPARSTNTEIDEVFVTEIDTVLKKNNFPIEIGDSVKNKYLPFLTVIYDVKDQASRINFENPTEIDELLARELRLKLVPNRTSADKFKKQEKSEKAMLNKLEDICYNLIETQSKLLESKLSEIENFQANKQKQIIADLVEQRITKLTGIVENPQIYPLDKMTDKDFEDFLKSQTLLKQQKEQEEKLKIEQLNLYNSRKEQLIPFWNFLKHDHKSADFGMLPEDSFQIILNEAKQLYDADQKAKADLKAENEKLQKIQDRFTQLTKAGLSNDGDEYFYIKSDEKRFSFSIPTIREMADNEFELALKWSKQEIDEDINQKNKLIQDRVKTATAYLISHGFVRLNPTHFKKKDILFSAGKCETLTFDQLRDEVEQINEVIESREKKAKEIEQEQQEQKIKSGSDMEKLKDMISSIQPPKQYEYQTDRAKEINTDINNKFNGFIRWALDEIAKLN